MTHTEAEAYNWRNEMLADDKRAADELGEKLRKLADPKHEDLRALVRHNAPQPRSEQVRVIEVRLRELLGSAVK